MFCLVLCLPQDQFAALDVPKKDNSQIEGPSIANSYGFKISMQNLQDAKALHEVSSRKTHILDQKGYNATPGWVYFPQYEI